MIIIQAFAMKASSFWAALCTEEADLWTVWWEGKPKKRFWFFLKLGSLIMFCSYQYLT